MDDRRMTGKRNRFLRYITAGFCLLFALVSLCGCSSVISSVTKTTQTDYTKGQIMVVAATERNRYQNIYTSRLWSVSADAQGTTFEELLKRQIEQFLEELAVVNLMAREQGIELTSQENDVVKTLSEEYYQGLTREDLEYLGVSEDEVYDLYSRYYLADKTVSALIDSRELEVSDAEAKVIEIGQIELDSREKAEEVLQKLSQEKADFNAIASENSLNPQINLKLEWKEDMGQLEQSAFSLEQDELSDIVESDGKFYIQKCINAYDEEATAERKNRLVQEKKTEAFRALYEPFIKEHTVKLQEGIWDDVDFFAGENCTTDNFFQLYHQYQ